MDDWLDGEGFVGNHAAFQGLPHQNGNLSQQEPEEIDDGDFCELAPFHHGCPLIHKSHARKYRCLETSQPGVIASSK